MSEKIYGPGDQLPAIEVEDTALDWEPGVEDEPEEDDLPEEGEGDEAE